MNAVKAINVSGRFHVLDQPYSSPSKCAFCGLGHNQDGKVQFIDTTLDLDFYGVVYICSNCLTEISASLGYISPDKWQDIVAHSTDTLIENERAKAENEGLRSAIATLTGHRCFNAAISESSVSSPKSEATDDESPSGIAEGIESGKSESDASSSEQGLPDVRRTTEFNDGVAIAKSVESRKRTKPVDLEL